MRPILFAQRKTPMSILPIYTVLMFAMSIGLIRRAKAENAVTPSQVIGLFGLLGALAIWVGVVTVLGLQGKHLALKQTVPLFWQPLTFLIICTVAIVVVPPIRRGLMAIAQSTPAWWFALIQATRIGAIGSIIKGLQGEIQSGYVFWVGIPDFLFGLSALGVAWLSYYGRIGRRALIAWNLVGFALIALPTFIGRSYWFAEDGFEFIFEFPMILAPAVVVSWLISFNLLHAWAIWRSDRA